MKKAPLTRKEKAYLKAQSEMVIAAKANDITYRRYTAAIKKMRKVESRMTEAEKVKAAKLVKTK